MTVSVLLWRLERLATEVAECKQGLLANATDKEVVDTASRVGAVMGDFQRAAGEAEVVAVAAAMPE